MNIGGRRESGNIEDRRSGGGGGFGGGLFGGGLKLGGGGLIVVLILSLLLGRNPLELIGGGGGGVAEPATEQTQTSQPQDEGGKFVAVVLASTEDVWGRILPEQANIQYEDPHLVLFRSETSSGCGYASSATGPFYCPGDRKVYIDLSFYDEMKNKLNAPGDFAMAYVIAHEVGHHIQNLMGVTDRLDRQRGQLSEAEFNKLSVRLELQADFLAGVWAHYAQKEAGFLDAGDIEEALNAANAIGDDRLQKQAQGYVVPDAFTHGTSEQRVRWFKKGFESGRVEDGDTFNQAI